MILKKPLITEMSSALQAQGVYTFEVAKGANKIEIRNAVQQKYNVNVVSVNTLIVPAKRKSRYSKSSVIEGRKPAYKKAIVKLAAGEAIDLYENM